MKKFFLSLIAIASISQSAYAKNYLRPLCNGHAGGCIPGEPEDPLYRGQMGASGRDMDPSGRVAPLNTPVGEAIKSAGFFDGITSWARDLAQRIKIFKFRSDGVKLRADGKTEIIDSTFGGFEASIEFYPPDRPIPPDAAPMAQPGANFVDGNGRIFLHIGVDEPAEKLYIAMSKFMNKDSWKKPFVDTDGSLLMVNGYGTYCYFPNYELNTILQYERVIMARKADLTGLVSTGQCEYPNKTGYVYNHGLWVKVNSDMYCETGWEWFNTKGWKSYELPDDSFMVNGFKRLANGGDCRQWFH
jgi:hypothetical protein